MKVYFDTCSLSRPVDDKTNRRVLVESEAVLAVLERCESGELALISSEILVFEVSRTPHPQRRAFVFEVLEQASSVVTFTDEIEQRAEVLVQRGFKAIDSLHIASAEAGHADYLCTCDDRFLKKAQLQQDLLVKVVSPLKLADEVLQ
jgi:predicted nucleic acid-binding protein